MKKVADTVDGNVLIEMSPDEWEYLQQKREATIYEIGWNTLEEWNRQFLDGLKKLNLSTRPFNALGSAASIWTTKYERKNGKSVEVQVAPYIRGRWTFEAKNNQLLDFEQWCDFILAHPDDWFCRNIGEKGKSEILQAIREYRKDDPNPPPSRPTQ